MSRRLWTILFGLIGAALAVMAAALLLAYVASRHSWAADIVEGRSAAALALKALEQFTPLSYFWADEQPPAALVSWLNSHPRLGLVAAWAGVLVQAPLVGLGALLLQTVVARVLARRPAFLDPIDPRVHGGRKPEGRGEVLRALDLFAAAGAKRGRAGRLYGVFGPEGVGAGYLAQWWLSELRWRWGGGLGWGWIVGVVRDPPPPGWKPRRPIAVLVDARTATPETWRAAAQLLRLPTSRPVRVLVVARADLFEFKDRLEDSVEVSVADALFHPAGAARPARGARKLTERVETRRGRQDQTRGDTSSVAPRKLVGFLEMGALDAGLMKQLARALRRELPRRLTDEQLQLAVDTANGLPGDLKRALEQIIQGRPIDHSRKFAQAAAAILDKACRAFPYAEGLFVAALAAMGNVRPVPSSVRLALAPAAADRLQLRQVFESYGPFDDDEHLPVVRDAQLAWELLLQALTRLQAADRQRLFRLVNDVDPALLPGVANEMGSRPDVRNGLAVALAGAREADHVIVGARSTSLLSVVEVSRAFGSLLTAAREPRGRWPIALGETAVEISARVASRVQGSLEPLLNMLAAEKPKDRQVLDLLARSPDWSTNARATARILAGLANTRDPTEDWTPGPDDPTRRGLEAWALLNDAFDRLGEPRSPAERASFTERGQMLCELTDGTPVDQLMAAWCACWLVGSYILTPTLADLPERLVQRLVRLASDEGTEPAVWLWATATLAKLAVGEPGEEDPIYRWALWADGLEPRLAAPALVGRPEFNQPDLLDEARRRLTESEAGSGTLAAALLLVTYREDVEALRTLAKAAADSLIPVDRRDAIIFRLVQVGSAASEHLAEAFRLAEEEDVRARIFVALLGLDLAASLSDDDIERFSGDPSYLELRRRLQSAAPSGGEGAT